ncbi:hypothetical protein ASC95_05080 [Pelomonas sp. Root1217]|uniref:hypothetical protein n=1 Tax=Pelomonas sp. Root1217 TaxID=1736430 RepID=UPI00070BECC5|nr:hypothetical protein [Pelomonas sp. Root1217]KQV60804.1 hypothetical protein ASC95_05080 [Pelomonas sp. Root1217]
MTEQTLQEQETPDRVQVTVGLQLGLGEAEGLPAFTVPLPATFICSEDAHLACSTVQFDGLSTKDIAGLQGPFVALNAMILQAAEANDRLDPGNLPVKIHIHSPAVVGGKLIVICDSTQEGFSLTNASWPPFDIDVVEALVEQDCQPWLNSEAE